VDELGVDLLSVSAHKLYGPKGVGALYVRRTVEISPILHGGGQERGLRPSTENVPGIVGFAKASEIALAGMEQREAKVTRLRDRLLRGLLTSVESSYLNGHERLRLPGNVNLTVRYVEGESLVFALDQHGVCVSTGSACGSREHEPSHVLRAMGLPPRIYIAP
jgi:cysteine desulfurase